MNNFVEIFPASGVGMREKIDPKACDGLVVFFRFTRSNSDFVKGLGHFRGCFGSGGGFVQVNPRDMEVRVVMKLFVRQFPALQGAR